MFAWFPFFLAVFSGPISRSCVVVGRLGFDLVRGLHLHHPFSCTSPGNEPVEFACCTFSLKFCHFGPLFLHVSLPPPLFLRFWPEVPYSYGDSNSGREDLTTPFFPFFGHFPPFSHFFYQKWPIFMGFS